MGAPMLAITMAWAPWALMRSTMAPWPFSCASLGTASTKARELSGATSTNAKYGVRPKCEQRGAFRPSSVSAVMQILMVVPLSWAHSYAWAQG